MKVRSIYLYSKQKHIKIRNLCFLILFVALFIVYSVLVAHRIDTGQKADKEAFSSFMAGNPKQVTATVESIKTEKDVFGHRAVTLTDTDGNQYIEKRAYTNVIDDRDPAEEYHKGDVISFYTDGSSFYSDTIEFVRDIDASDSLDINHFLLMSLPVILVMIILSVIVQVLENRRRYW